MAESKPITTELFRFASLRGPQLIPRKQKNIGFVFHPNSADSSFLKGLTGSETSDELKTILNDRIAVFNSLNVLDDVKRQNIEIYEFSSWLMKQRNELNRDEVREKVSNLSPLSEQVRLDLWDNLFYQILVLNSAYVRQGCIQMIIADHFLQKMRNSHLEEELAVVHVPRKVEEYSSEERLDIYLKRIAHSSVVVPSFGFFKKVEDTEESRPNVSNLELEENFLSALEIEVDLSYLSLKDELNELEKSYSVYYEKEYLTQKGKIDYSNAAKRKIFNKKIDGKEENTIDGDALKLAPLNLKIKGPYSKTFLDGLDLQPQTLDVLKNKEKYNSNVKTSIIELNSQQKIERRQLLSKRTFAPKVRIAGIPLDRKPSEMYSYTFGLRHPEYAKGKSEAYLLIKIPNPDIYILKAKYKMGLPKLDQAFGGIKVEELESSKANYLFVKLFPAKTPFAMPKGPYTFKGEFKLSNGKSLSIEFSSHTKSTFYTSMSAISGDVSTPPPPPIYGVNRIGIADYRRVEQELCCYIPGEVSHIENVMAKEYKERSTRNLTSTEDRLEQSSELELENLSDTVTTSRNELQSEIASAFETERSNEFGMDTGFKAKLGERLEFNIGADMEFATSNSASSNNSIARTVAEEVTKRALAKVVQKTSIKRTSIVKREFEENNRHGFDNRNGEEHVSGVYRWVDKLYKNSLVNYGKRLMYEFMVPEPSKLYKEAIFGSVEENAAEVAADETNPAEIVVPTLASFDIHTKEDITYERAIEASNAYKDLGAMLLEPITELIPELSEQGFSVYAPAGISSNFKTVVDFTHPDLALDVTDGYLVTSVDVTAEYEGRNRSMGKHNFRLKINGFSANWDITGWDVDDYRHTRNFKLEYTAQEVQALAFFGIQSNPYTGEGTLPLNVSGIGFRNHSVSGTMFLRRKEQVKQDWQQAMYDILDKAYRDALLIDQISQMSEPLSTEPESNEKEAVEINPAFLRDIEKRELKRVCLELMIKPFSSVSMGEGWYQDETLDCSEEEETLPEVIQTIDFEKYASQVKFFEQAFDWELMSYIFYPYFWADKCDWKELLRTNNDDGIFQSFLRSGMARVVVPVRVGFEEAVTYYMDSGDIWNGRDLVVDSEDDLYLSIVEELRTVDGVVEDNWELRVPSSLTVIQSDSIGLDASGLPCCDTDDESLDEIIESSSTLQRAE